MNTQEIARSAYRWSYQTALTSEAESMEMLERELAEQVERVVAEYRAGLNDGAAEKARRPPSEPAHE
jgi:hypothetical protein